jgi:polygalacturonase
MEVGSFLSKTISMLRPKIFAGLLGCIVSFPAYAQSPAPPPSAPALPVIPDKTFSVTDYGAVGDCTTMNTAALQKAIDAVSQAGGGTLTVPAGKFLTGPLTLASSMNLQLAKDAVLLISNDMATYPSENSRCQNCVSANDAHDIEISGEGTIDGQGAVWWKAFRANNAMTHRPYMVSLSHCTRVEVTGVTLTNSPMFHLVPGRCTDVTIKGVTIIAPPDSPNTDGIDPSGSNYLIDGCTIDTGDDNIAVKPASTEKDQNYTITNCKFLRGHGMSLGSGSDGGIENMTVSNCTFDGTTSGIRIKTGRGKGGLVRNITYDHLTMTKVKIPVNIADYYPKPPSTPTEDPAQAVTPLTPTFAAITISNVTSTGSPSAGLIWGLPEMPITGITFNNVHISAAKGLTVVHAHDIHFSNSDITVESGDKLILSDAEATGLN